MDLHNTCLAVVDQPVLHFKIKKQMFFYAYLFHSNLYFSILKGHYTLVFHVAVTSKVFKKCDVVLCTLQPWLQEGVCVRGLHHSQIYTHQQDARCWVMVEDNGW